MISETNKLVTCPTRPLRPDVSNQYDSVEHYLPLLGSYERMVELLRSKAVRLVHVHCVDPVDV